MKLSWFLTALAFYFAPQAQAWPTGAGSCQGGKAATTGVNEHNNKATTTSGGLSEGEYMIKIDGKVVDHYAATPTKIPVGIDVSLELLSAPGTNFKGFLLRLSSDTASTSTLDTLSTGGSNIKVLDLCTSEGVAGLTHTMNDHKTSVMGKLMVPKADANLMLDVTVARSNGGVLSEYFYDGFPLVAEETMASSAGPTNAELSEQLKTIETMLVTLLQQCGGPAPGGAAGAPANSVAKTGDFP